MKPSNKRLPCEAKFEVKISRTGDDSIAQFNTYAEACRYIKMLLDQQERGTISVRKFK